MEKLETTQTSTTTSTPAHKNLLLPSSFPGLSWQQGALLLSSAAEQQMAPTQYTGKETGRAGEQRELTAEDEVMTVLWSQHVLHTRRRAG